MADTSSFQKTNPPDFRHVFIAVMGMTGVGKSSFIKTLTKSDIAIGHGVESCTPKVSSHAFQHGKFIVHLVDTPGFNDTNKSDTDTLNEIAIWLAMTYRADVRLTGIIYLHRISDNRMTGSAVHNLNMFKKLCGDDCLPNVILATTMWSANQQERAEQEQREAELITDSKFWGSLIRGGATTQRYDATFKSALGIIGRIEHRKQIVLDIQHQIANEGRSLAQTPAGQYLRENILRKEEENRLKLEAARGQLKEALRNKDEKFAAEMEQQMIRAQDKLKEARIDNARLREDLSNKLEENNERIRELAASASDVPWGSVISKVIGGLGAIGLAVLTSGGSLVSLPMSQLAMEMGELVTTFAAQSTADILGM